MTRLRVEELRRRFGSRDVVDGVSFDIEAAESVALVGPSGCGKTTLLQMIGLLDQPDGGEVVIDGVAAWGLTERQRATLRLSLFGFVFQERNLLSSLSARDNVALPAWQLGGSRRKALARAEQLLERFGLAARAHAAVDVLSTGEAQRVAIARALVNGPAVVLADEPTGSLDSRSTAQVMEALSEVRADGAALLIVTHSDAIAEAADRRITMLDGKVRQESGQT